MRAFIAALLEMGPVTVPRPRPERSFDSLPSKRPYGFWALPDGSFLVVHGPYGHATMATEFGFKSKDEAMAAGWSRLAFAHRGMGKYDLWSRCPKALTATQNRTIRDLAAWYHAVPEYENR